MMQNKYHWYDGWFYDKVIAPNQDRLFGEIKNLIPPASKIIDVGCGTGRLPFMLADKSSFILGIDLSKRNIYRAIKTLDKTQDKNISFRHTNLTEVIAKKEMHFDFAVMTYVIHEVDEDKRVMLLREAASVADTIILGDYLIPVKGQQENRVTKIIEFVAGKEHYRNYKSYMANGGIHYLANKAELNIIQEKRNELLNNHIVLLSK